MGLGPGLGRVWVPNFETRGRWVWVRVPGLKDQGPTGSQKFETRSHGSGSGSLGFGTRVKPGSFRSCKITKFCIFFMKIQYFKLIVAKHALKIDVNLQK